jgi:hypothetical protein
VFGKRVGSLWRGFSQYFNKIKIEDKVQKKRPHPDTKD